MPVEVIATNKRADGIYEAVGTVTNSEGDKRNINCLLIEGEDGVNLHVDDNIMTSRMGDTRIESIGNHKAQAGVLRSKSMFTFTKVPFELKEQRTVENGFERQNLNFNK